MPRYVVVTEREVAPQIVEMARDFVLRALPELDLGATPEIRFFADSRELPPGRVSTASLAHDAGLLLHRSFAPAAIGRASPYVRIREFGRQFQYPSA